MFQHLVLFGAAPADVLVNFPRVGILLTFEPKSKPVHVGGFCGYRAIAQSDQDFKQTHPKAGILASENAAWQDFLALVHPWIRRNRQSSSG